MRDGAEMDLDLEITQRMIEDEEDYIEKINMVIPKLQDANLLIKQENEMLEKEFKWQEGLKSGFENYSDEIKKLQEEIEKEEKLNQELLAKV